jgi:hypothetical protein
MHQRLIAVDVQHISGDKMPKLVLDAALGQ